MTTAAKTIIHRATDMIQDQTSVRWPADELVRWLNDGQNEILVYRPDALNIKATVTLAAGVRQSLDAMNLTPKPAKLLDITYNTAPTSKKGAITLTQRQILDAYVPAWHALPGSIDIQHHMFDARDPKSFMTYPPALAGAQVEVMYAGQPTPVAEPASGALWSDVVGDIGVPDINANALLDYILYRAYSKDSEFAGNEQRAAGHYAAFTQALGADITATVKAAPQAKPGAQLTAS